MNFVSGTDSTTFRYHLQTNPGVLNGVAFTNSLGLQGLAPGLPTNVTGLPVISFSGIGITPIQQSVPYVNPGYLNRTYQVQDNVSWFHGRHDMKFGFEGGHVDYNNYGAPSNLFGSMTFAPTFTSGGISGQGNPYADFLLGIPASSSISYPPIEQLAYRWYYRFFALDDFKITPKLTVNIGLRYELAPYWSEHNDHIALFDTANGKIVVPDKGLSTVSPFMPTSYVQTVGASFRRSAADLDVYGHGQFCAAHWLGVSAMGHADGVSCGFWHLLQ